MNTNTVQPYPIGTPWNFLLPSDHDCRRIRQRFPTLTARGFYPYKRYERENDRRAFSLPPAPPIHHEPPIPIDRIDVREDIARVRLFIQSVTGKWFSGPTGHTLRREVIRWAKRDIFYGAVIAGAFLEDRIIARKGRKIVVSLWLPVEIYSRLKVHDPAALAVMGAVLANMRKNYYDNDFSESSEY